MLPCHREAPETTVPKLKTVSSGASAPRESVGVALLHFQRPRVILVEAFGWPVSSITRRRSLRPALRSREGVAGIFRRNSGTVLSITFLFQELETMDINRQDTALVVTDPQNDFLSEKGVTWDLVGENVKENGTIENIERLF